MLWVSLISKLKSITKVSLGTPDLINLMGTAVIYIHFRRSHQPVSLKISTDQVNIRNHNNKFTKAGLVPLIKYFSRLAFANFAVPKAFFVVFNKGTF